MVLSLNLFVENSRRAKLHTTPTPISTRANPGYFRGFMLYLHEKAMLSNEGTMRSQLNLTFALRNSGLKYLPKKAPSTALGAESLWTNSPGTWPCNIAKVVSETSDPTCICSEGWNEIRESYRCIKMYGKRWIRLATVKSKQLTFQKQPPFYGSNFGSKTKFKVSSFSQK